MCKFWFRLHGISKDQFVADVVLTFFCYKASPNVHSPSHNTIGGDGQSLLPSSWF
jgi:hypothetical protein